jgi:anti-sigma B factor antagonist
MSSPGAKMSVLIGEHFACVRIAGRANFSSSIDFRTLLSALLEKGYRYFVLDLSECTLMDSTFLGVLAGFGLKLNSPQPAPGNAAIELLNPNERISELLENLGVLHLFRVAQKPFVIPEGAYPCETQSTNPTKQEFTRACLEAHQTLMAINPDNVARFKDLTQFLAEDLNRLKEQ